MAGLPPLGGGCGASTVRLTPRATVQPCVYWPGSGEPLDFYCPVIRGERPRLQIQMAATRDLPKLSSSCTTVVIARDDGN